MNKKESEFNKVFSAWDILVIAFGAMIDGAGLYQPETGLKRAAFLERHLDFALAAL